MPRRYETEKRIKNQIIKMQDRLAHSINHATPSKLTQQKILLQGKRDFLKTIIAKNKKKEIETRKK
jgi:hypothetical protein